MRIRVGRRRRQPMVRIRCGRKALRSCDCETKQSIEHRRRMHGGNSLLTFFSGRQSPSTTCQAHRRGSVLPLMATVEPGLSWWRPRPGRHRRRTGSHEYSRALTGLHAQSEKNAPIHAKIRCVALQSRVADPFGAWSVEMLPFYECVTI